MRAKGALTALLLLAAALTAVVPAVEEVATSAASATASAADGQRGDRLCRLPGRLRRRLPRRPQPGSVRTKRPGREAVGEKLGAPLVAPVGAALTRAGWASNSTGFSALQSTGTCSGPFTFSTVFETNSEVNRFDISLVSADLSQGVTVEGTTTGPKAGIWTGNSLSPPGAEGSYELDANPYNHVLYAVTISVDAAGNASVALADYRDGRVLGASPPIAVGTGPLYVVLGEGHGSFWGTASIIPAPQPCSVQDDFGADPGLTPYWSSTTTAPESVLTSVASTINANFEPPALDFNFAPSPVKGMFLGGVRGDNEFSAVQSVDACADTLHFQRHGRRGG